MTRTATRRQRRIRNNTPTAASDDDEYNYGKSANPVAPHVHDTIGWSSTDEDEYESDIRTTDDEGHGGTHSDDESYRSMATTTSRRNGQSEPEDDSTRDENESAEAATDHELVDDDTAASSSASRNETVQPPPLHDASIDMQTTIYVLLGFLKRAGYRRSTSRALTLVHTKDCNKKVSTKAWILNQAHIAAMNGDHDGSHSDGSTSVSSDSAWLDTKLVDVLLGQVGALDHIAQCLHFDFLWMDTLEQEHESTLHSHPPRTVTTLPKRAHASKKHVR